MTKHFSLSASHRAAAAAVHGGSQHSVILKIQMNTTPIGASFIPPAEMGQSFIQQVSSPLSENVFQSVNPSSSAHSESDGKSLQVVSTVRVISDLSCVQKNLKNGVVDKHVSKSVFPLKT